jgi:hypothetical protein
MEANVNDTNRRKRSMPGKDPARPRIRVIPTSVLPSMLVLLIAACGSSGSSRTTRPHPSSTDVAHAPSDLLGTYTTTLKRGDLPTKPPRELTYGPRTWKLTIANSGGPNGSDAFTIANASLGPLESSPFSVQGNNILLHNEECDAGGTATFYDNEYSYKLTGQTLTLTTIKNQCSDQVTRTILTSEPWRKTGR